VADIYGHVCRKQKNWINSKNYQNMSACDLLHILAIGSWKIVNRREATPNSISSEVDASTAACVRARVNSRCDIGTTSGHSCHRADVHTDVKVSNKSALKAARYSAHQYAKLSPSFERSSSPFQDLQEASKPFKHSACKAISGQRRSRVRSFCGPSQT